MYEERHQGEGPPCCREIIRVNVRVNGRIREYIGRNERVREVLEKMKFPGVDLGMIERGED